MRVAVLVETFPCATEVPVLNQLCGLLDAGVQLEIFCLKSDPEPYHKKVYDYELHKKVKYIPKNPIRKFSSIWLSRIYLWMKTLPLLISSIFRRPDLVFRSVWSRNYSDLVNSFYLFYLAYYFEKHPTKADVVLCQFAPWGAIGAALKDLGVLKGEIVTAFRGYGVNVFPKTKPSNYFDVLKKHGAAFTANTNDTKHSAVKLGFTPEKISIIHSTLNTSEIPFKVRQWSQGEKLHVLSVGSLLPIKGPQFGIRAMAALKTHLPELDFIYRIVGKGPLESELQQLIQEINLEKNVELMGFKNQDELMDIYLQSHLLLHPSIETETGSKEAQGLVLQEAQASGLPVIASNVGGISEGLIPEITGKLVPQKDEKALCEAIIWLLNNSAQWSAMGQAGRKFVEQEFDVQVQTSKLLDLFEHVTKQHQS